MKPHPAIIIQADERRGAGTRAAQKRVEHELVESIMANGCGQAVPRREIFVGVEKGPVLCDANLKLTTGVGCPTDDTADLLVGAGHVANHAAKAVKLPFELG